jgi:Zn-dependent protease with chaperone function
MSFDPKVLESIRRYRKHVRASRIMLLTPFIIAVTVGVAMLALTLLLRLQVLDISNVSGAWEGSDWMAQAAALVKLFSGVLAVVVVGGLGYSFVTAVRYARARFRLFLEEQSLEFEQFQLNKFTGALEGASIAADVEAPYVIVLDDPSANALAFEQPDGGRGVGVTVGLLAADIPVSEADAVMAHELAHLIIGENVREPALTDLEYQPSLLLLLFCMLATASVLLAPNDIAYIGVLVLCTAVVLLAMTLIYRSKAFIMKLLDLGHRQDDILADSLAALITRDPGALMSAITRIEELARACGRVPGGTVLARYLFVTPPTAAGDYFRYTSRTAGQILGSVRQPRTWMVFEKPLNRGMAELLELERSVTRDRLINLDLIEQGRWRTLEDWSRD